MSFLFKGIALVALLSSTALVTPGFAQSGDQMGGGMNSGGGSNSMGAGAGDDQTGGRMGGDSGAGAAAGAGAGGGAGAGAAACDQANAAPDCPSAGGMNGQRGAGEDNGNMGSEQANPKSGGDEMQNSQQTGGPSEKGRQEPRTGGSENGSANGSGNGTTGAGNGTTGSEGASGGANDKTGENASPNSAGGNEKRSTNVNVSVEQKTEIRQQIKDIHVAPVGNVDFNVSVGVAVPKTVHLRPLPARIATLVPGYRGFLFFVLADGRIVIVDPHSLEIVFIA